MSERNITRMEYGRTVGYWVRLYRTNELGEKECFSKHFSDGVCGGKGKALKAAREWRDKRAKKLTAPRKSGSAVPVGHGYVRRALRKQRVGYHGSWVAWLRIEDGRCKSTSRSIAVHGVAGAKRECEKWLKEQRSALRKRLRG